MNCHACWNVLLTFNCFAYSVPMFTILEATKFNCVCLSHFQIESLDDHSGRLLIKLALGGTKDWFNEFMVQPVSKAEYAQYGKVLSKFNIFF